MSRVDQQTPDCTQVIDDFDDSILDNSHLYARQQLDTTLNSSCRIDYPVRMELIEKDKFRTFFEKFDEQKLSHYIPCMYIPFGLGSSKLLIYFHANAEDIGLVHQFLSVLRTLLRVNVLAMEYPGYGFFTKEFQNVRTKESKLSNTRSQKSSNLGARTLSSKSAFNMKAYNMEGHDEDDFLPLP